MGIGVSELVGWVPDAPGRDAMAPAARFAASGDVSVSACTVLPQSWPFPRNCNETTVTAPSRNVDEVLPPIFVPAVEARTIRISTEIVMAGHCAAE